MKEESGKLFSQNGNPVINQDLVLLDLKASNSEEVLNALSDRLFERGFVKASFKEAVLERERSFPTGIPSLIPVAIPHTDAHHNLHSALAVGVLAEPIEFHVMGFDEETTPVRLVFMLTLTEPKSQAAWLGRLTKIIRQPTILEEFLSAHTAAQIESGLRHHLILEERD